MTLQGEQRNDTSDTKKRDFCRPRALSPTLINPELRPLKSELIFEYSVA
jgi:hypothetical protein